MKNQLLNERMLKLKSFWCVLILGVIFSITGSIDAYAQGGTIVTGELFVYKSATNESDTTGLVGENLYVKFYRLNGANQLMFVASAPVDSTGFFKVKVYSSQDLYAIIVPNDDQDNFVSTYYPGWLDFESAEPIETAGQDTIDYDWGAVGKEIVERPSGVVSTISGVVSPYIPSKSDYIPSVYLFTTDGTLLTSAPIGPDGRYNLNFYGAGEYEVFTSIPGYSSESKFISSSTTRGDFTVNFELDVYNGDNEVTPSTVVADNFNLTQNYPNPFNPTTNISFTVNTTGIVKLTVYNSLGKEVTKLVNDLVEPGTYDVTFNGQNLASGIYYYTLQVGNSVVTKKMNLIK
jgi:hypothetical protein